MKRFLLVLVGFLEEFLNLWPDNGSSVSRESMEFALLGVELPKRAASVFIDLKNGSSFSPVLTFITNLESRLNSFWLIVISLDQIFASNVILARHLWIAETGVVDTS